MSSARVRWRRSASGNTLSLLRSNGVTLIRRPTFYQMATGWSARDRLTPTTIVAHHLPFVKDRHASGMPPSDHSLPGCDTRDDAYSTHLGLVHGIAARACRGLSWLVQQPPRQVERLLPDLVHFVHQVLKVRGSPPAANASAVTCSALIPAHPQFQRFLPGLLASNGFGHRALILGRWLESVAALQRLRVMYLHWCRVPGHPLQVSYP